VPCAAASCARTEAAPASTRPGTFTGTLQLDTYLEHLPVAFCHVQQPFTRHKSWEGWASWERGARGERLESWEGWESWEAGGRAGGRCGELGGVQDGRLPLKNFSIVGFNQFSCTRKHCGSLIPVMRS
jgi:hypothetical protein